MCAALVQVYLHFIWGTWDRLPLIDKDNEQLIYKSIMDKCVMLGSKLIELGGMPDHIHLLVRFPAIVSIANFIKEIKGSTSHLVTHRDNSNEFFKWQGSYAVYSVNTRDIPKIKAYIQHQKEHHIDYQTYPEYEL